MKSIQSKNISPGHSNHSPFFQKGSTDFSRGRKNKPFFNASPVQAKLTVNEPGDQYEKEADSIADKVVQRLSDKSFSVSENNPTYFFNKPGLHAQRKCASREKEEKLQKKEEDDKNLLKDKLQKKSIFESNEPPRDDDKNIQKKCAECEEEEKLHKKDEPSSETTSSNVESSLSASRGSGNPLPPAALEQMESSFGADFSGVKIHNDNTSVQMNESLNAQAFTHGNDIYFNSGKYNSNNKEGRHLLAHELTHVVQQSGGKNIQKQGKTSGTGNISNSQGRFLTDDSATPAEGQMTKSDFLRRLNSEVCATVDEAVQSIGSSSDNCPYIREVFTRYQNNTPAQIEAVLQRYEPSTQSAGSADDLIQMIKAHAFTAALQWAATGALPALADSVSSQISSGISSVSNAVSTVATGISNAVSGIGNLFFKAKPRANHAAKSPLGVMQSLGKGNPMNNSTRGKMESAFGTNFSDVQIHTDSKASGLSNSMNARAFTVGNHIAFGSGEHKPGTLVGDALMAHELAHTIQQSCGKADGTQMKSSSNHAALEEEADMSAVGAIISMQRGKTGTLMEMSKKATPKMKSGLSITSCKKTVPHTPCLSAELVSIETYQATASGWVSAALTKLRETPTRADVIASLQRNFGPTDGVATNLPGIIAKIAIANAEMISVPVYCAGTEDSTCATPQGGGVVGGYSYPGGHEFLVCRNSLSQSDPILHSHVVLHEAFHSAFSSFSVDSYSGFYGVVRTPGYPGSDPLVNADSYTTLVIDLR